MQVSKSALRTLIQQSSTAPTRLPCCCCRGFSSSSAESAGPSNDLAQVLRNSTGGPFSLGPEQAGPSARAPENVYERNNHPQSQRARLQAHEKRRTVLLNGLGPHMTPGDIRRFAASKLRNPESVLEVVPLPAKDLRPIGRALIEFDSAYSAARMMDATKRRSHPSNPGVKMQCSLVEPARVPVTKFIGHRIPLSLDRYAAGALSEDGSMRVAATLAYSGRTVRITGLPRLLPVQQIRDKLAEEEFEIVGAPGLEKDGRPMEDVVVINGHNDPYDQQKGAQGDRVSVVFGQFLVRLPSIAEAHRLVREWHSTWPIWGGMEGAYKVSAEVVW